MSSTWTQSRHFSSLSALVFFWSFCCFLSAFVSFRIKQKLLNRCVKPQSRCHGQRLWDTLWKEVYALKETTLLIFMPELKVTQVLLRWVFRGPFYRICSVGSWSGQPFPVFKSMFIRESVWPWYGLEVAARGNKDWHPPILHTEWKSNGRLHLQTQSNVTILQISRCSLTHPSSPHPHHPSTQDSR